MVDALRRMYVDPREVDAEWVRKFTLLVWSTAGGQASDGEPDSRIVMLRLEEAVEDRLLSDREQETALEALELYDSEALD